VESSPYYIKGIHDTDKPFFTGIKLESLIFDLIDSNQDLQQAFKTLCIECKKGIVSAESGIKNFVQTLKQPLEKEISEQIEAKENQILKVFVDHIGNDQKIKAHFLGQDDINSEFLNLMKRDPQIQKDFKKLCNEFKDRSAAEIQERLPESNLFMKIMHYIQNLFKNTLRGQVKETKKSFTAALSKEKEQRNPGQGLSTQENLERVKSLKILKLFKFNFSTSCFKSFFSFLSIFFRNSFSNFLWSAFN
jgi:hypothetical protein